MAESRVVVITGMSGAGKSTAARCLEDIGFYCIDNLPTTLIPKLGEFLTQAQPSLSKIALVIDVREGELFDSIPQEINELRRMGLKCEILFLDASDMTLIRRFSQTRRRHPLGGHSSLLEGIRREREMLVAMKDMADWIVDTTEDNVHLLRERIAARFTSQDERTKLDIRIVSFGYRFGVPAEADLVFDVRFLPNPFYIEGLGPLSGEDTPVREFVLGHEVTGQFIEKCMDLLRFLLPRYLAEGKVYLTIALGCTGGRHRSVVMADEIRRLLETDGYDVRIRHRDIDR
ncbi:MAG: RNase adapter RapZ [Candidatus Hydrogenedentes bacterium]|nr:RNase adapter RapZ [Candidatus Hydrogenedentota bacterium]